MKAILMSIKPKWCEKIFSGKKTIEVRKIAPKLETPFKVYVYCTKERMTRVPSIFAYLHKNEPRACAEYGTIVTWGKIGDVTVNPHLASKHVSFGMHGKVVGEFVCDENECFTVGSLRCDEIEELACLSHKEMIEYFYKPEELDGKTVKAGTALHIANPKLYDTPKELSEFRKPDVWYTAETDNTSVLVHETGTTITRPPQSFMYVEEIEE